MKPEHQAQIARLEAEAARHPVAYRWRLGAVAIAGDILLTGAQIAPWALPIAGGVLVVNHPFFYWLGAAALVLFVYLVRPGLRLRGRELTQREAPKLFAEMDALRDKLQVRGRMDVMLDDSFNAGALETRGLFGLVGTRRVLILGIPLLAALTREQVLAVIAHEFGHFSRRHGRLGHWLYRARVGWIEFSHQLEQSDLALDRAAAWCAELLVPYFSRLSFVHSRRCEYEADADAAAATGSGAFAQALTGVAVGARLWEEGFPTALARLRLNAAAAPVDFYERFASAAGTWPTPELEKWRAEALREPPSWLDTHPRLAERLAALGEVAKPEVSSGGAGSELLGETWPIVLGEFNAAWREGAQWEWAFEHLRFKHLLAPLLAGDAAAMAQWPHQDLLARAKALRAISPAEGLAELRQLHERNPGEAAITLAYGAALLIEKDPAGVPLLEGLVLDQPAFRVPVYLRLANYYSRSDDEASKRWLTRLDGAAKRRAAAAAMFMQNFELGRATASTLSTQAQALVADAVSLDPCVDRAWLLAGREPLATNELAHAADLEIHALILTLDPNALAREGAHDGTATARYRYAMEALVAADAEVVVKTYFTTEHLPAALNAYAELPLSRDVEQA